MTEIEELRRSYMELKGYAPDSIPGRACLRGDYDDSDGFKQHVADTLRHREPAGE